MRFKRGSQVEVFSKEELNCGSWRCGEIVSGNGHNYDVRYSLAVGVTGAPVVERVSRKVIRPSPPLVHSCRDLVPGELVEVFERMSWKVAIVSKVSGANDFMVRLIGSSQELRAHKSEIRVRQIWKDDEWVMVGMSLGGADGKSDTRYYQRPRCKVSGKCAKRKLHEEDDCSLVKNTDFQESRMVSSRTLKKGLPNGLSYIEAYGRDGAVAKEFGRQQIATERPFPLPKKVDAVASPLYMLGVKHMRASFYNQISEMDTERAGPNGDNLKFSDAESSACSVGSCSINSNKPYRLPESSDSDCHSSDAESFCGWRYEKKCHLPSKEDLAEKIHRLELHAYRCTMGALFCSGPLSWEQEELVTNLRLILHISNDEHLMELRNLVSGETNPITS
ncbi:Plant tudor-like rna-binding protein [Thalictrum thalictroides]|uniref:Plant tudor-like rna-binding protein n=1 Tax=Thalictrum thalictroides TaxID=46969 RepID=A0A7J6W250_THATH|nr:Plant tudor-like rna-binding protein [Thalictrum thalictroides]